MTKLDIAHFLFLLRGAAWTILLSAIAAIGGGLFGFLLALCRISPIKVVRVAAGIYVQLVQGTPLIVIMFLVYFGLPALGLRFTPLLAASVALMIFVSAYLGEIWRGCIESVPKAQWEAAECLALNNSQRMFKVVLPQAIRIATPPTVGFLVQIVKGTSLASVVGFVELTRAGQIINSSLFEPFPVFLLIALIYFSFCYPLSVWSRRLEKRGPALQAGGL